MPEAWLNQFASRLQQLEDAASGTHASFADLNRTAQHAMLSLAEVSKTSVFLVRPDAVECVLENGRAEPVSDDVAAQAGDAVRQGNLVREVTSSSGKVVHQRMVAHPLAEQLDIVFEIVFTSSKAPEQSLIEGAKAVAAVLAVFVSRNLLSQYEVKLSNQAAVVDVISRLYQSPTMADAAGVLAHDAAAACGDCRVTVVTETNGHYRAVAVTGVSQPKSESETVAVIEQLAVAAAAGRLPLGWINVDDTPGDLAQHRAVLTNGGVQQVCVIPLSGRNQPGTETAPNRNCPAYMVLELFAEHSRPDTAVVQQITNAAGPVFDRLHTAQQPLFAGLIRSRRMRRLAVILGVLALLALWPVDFEIEVFGQIESSHQRRIFAPQNGTVDEVLFENEMHVEMNQPLLRMSNPDLDLELQRVQGEIETTATRLASVAAARLTGSDPRFSGDEQQLQQQLDNLNKEKSLLEAQLELLQVTSPIDGTVYLRDPHKVLNARPVQRGQMLLEIVPNDGQWQLDLEIPDYLRTYLDEYRSKNDSPAPIRYMIRAAPEQDWTTFLTSVDDAVQVVDGKLICGATARLQQLPNEELRPGTSVSARIFCGRRSVGFVFLREVIEFWEQFRFAWLS